MIEEVVRRKEEFDTTDKVSYQGPLNSDVLGKMLLKI